jgi:hypothetical protein
MRTTVDKRKTHRMEINKWKVGDTLEFQSLDQGDNVYIESVSPKKNKTDMGSEKNKIFIRRPKADRIPHSYRNSS